MIEVPQLFIKAPSFPKLAYANISQNPEDWVHDVLKLAYEQIPFVMGGGKYQTKVKIERKDPSRGYAYGYITINENASVPIIIDNFTMKDLDVFLMDGKFYPLDEKTLDEALFNSKLVGNPKDISELDSQTYTGLFPPSVGKYVHASDRNADMLYIRQRLPHLMVDMTSKLAGKVRERDLKKLSADLYTDDLRAGFRINKTLAVVAKIATLAPQKWKNALDSLPPNVTQIVRKGPDRFLVRMATDRYWSPVEVEVSREKVFKFFGEKVAEKALKEGEVAWTEGVRPWTPQIWEDVDKAKKAKKISSPGFYRVRSEIHGNLHGWFYPKTVDLEGGNMGMGLFFDPEKDLFGFQDDVFGSSDDSNQTDTPKLSEMRVGRKGVFLLGDNKVTLPLTIQTPPIDLGSHVICEVADELGTVSTIELTPSVDGIQKSDKPKSYLVSNTLPWVEVGQNQVRLQDATTPTMEKGAADKAVKSMILVRVNDDGTYSLTGDLGAMGAAGGNQNRLERYRSKFCLMGIGLSPTEADQALQKAKSEGQITIVGGKVPNTQAEKYGSLVKVAGEKEAKILRLRPGLLKEAASIDDEATVDKVLSLNLITPENMKIFLEGIPSFKDAVSRLAQLLILVRVGRKDIPEAAVKRAMESMSIVLSALNDIQSEQRTLESA